MDKVIVIGDIHGRQFWKEATYNLKDTDKIIFLGDYVDPYPIEGIGVVDAIDNFKEIVAFKEDNPDKVVLLQGNHDLHYYSQSFAKHGKGSRYNQGYALPISNVFINYYPLFQLAYQCEIGDKKYLFTHAGITTGWMKDNNKFFNGKIDVDKINNLRLDEMHFLGDVSFNRGGPKKYGSMVWADIDEHFASKKQIPDDVYQIFGHTMQEVGHAVITDHFACLDCQRPCIITKNGIEVT